MASSLFKVLVTTLLLLGLTARLAVAHRHHYPDTSKPPPAATQTPAPAPGTQEVLPGEFLLADPPSFAPTIVYEPLCNATSPADRSDWHLWSDLATWGGRFTEVPGTGQRVNVTIECGQFVLLDVPALADGEPSINLGILNITGTLAFLDDSSVGALSLAADFIFVYGNLTIGSPGQHFSSQATMTLTGYNKVPQPLYQDLGFKVLAIIGGSINLYGMPGGGSTPSWASLTQMGAAGSSEITLDQDVSAWPIGSQVAIATTDFDVAQTEVLTITGTNGTVLYFDPPLNYTHWAPSVPTGMPGLSMPIAAEVLLIQRNILITATQEPPPYNLTGGHVIVYYTRTPQAFVGVEFERLGQQGTLGRYPLHHHLCGSVPANLVQKNSVHDSLQRCYVVHGTHNLTLSDNVAYNNTGHCFMIEDGIEMDNVFVHNLGVTTVAPEVLVADTVLQTDNEPAMFWSASPMNSWVDNTAVGAASTSNSSASGFWLQMRSYVTGASASTPGADTLKPISEALGLFDSNTAHSSAIGLRMYAEGYHPADDAVFTNFVTYKSNQMGMSFHESSNMVVEGAMIADTVVGVDLNGQEDNSVLNTIIIGASDNIGNPVACGETPTAPYACEPVALDCTVPLDYRHLEPLPGVAYRTAPSGLFSTAKTNYTTLGINLAANTAINNTFVNFNNPCRVGIGAVGVNHNQPAFIPANGYLAESTLINVGKYNAFADPELVVDKNEWYVIKDQDGSTLGEAGAYLVQAGNPLLLPPEPQLSQDCINHSAWNAALCTGLCYRSVQIAYDEPGNFSEGQNYDGYSSSYLQLTRQSDDLEFTLTATAPGIGLTNIVLNKTSGAYVWPRVFSFNVLGDQTYTVAIVGGNQTYQTDQALLASLSASYVDMELPISPPCDQEATFTLAALPGVNSDLSSAPTAIATSKRE